MSVDVFGVRTDGVKSDRAGYLATGSHLQTVIGPNRVAGTPPDGRSQALRQTLTANVQPTMTNDSRARDADAVARNSIQTGILYTAVAQTTWRGPEQFRVTSQKRVSLSPILC